jgi:hypothetical protein
MRRLLVLGFWALAAGCGSGAHDLAHTPVSIGPIRLRAGQETTQCIVAKLPSAVDVDVVEIDAMLAPGSHHLIVYKSMSTTESLTPSGCTAIQGMPARRVPTTSRLI